MRSNIFKSVLVKSGLAVAALLMGSEASFAQQIINLTAGPVTASLPDGSSVPMWGYSCTGATGTATCAALNPAAATLVANITSPTIWSPIVITIPYTADPVSGANTTALQIILTNNLTFTPSSPAGAPANGVPTSLTIVGQLGGGLGTTATSTSSPDHSLAQQQTWFLATPGVAANTPPGQGSRVQSFSTEVAATGATLVTGQVASPGTINWSGLRPGTYLIESGTHPSIQGPMGLYGVLVVTAAPGATAGAAGCAYPGATAGTCAVPYNSELPLLLSEIDPVQNVAVSTAVNTAGFSETKVWSGQPGQCGNPGAAVGVVNTCYPPAVNYTPLYYLFNGVAFDKTNAPKSLFAASTVTGVATGATGSVLVRLVNAGLRMHVPSIVGALTTDASSGTPTTVSGMSLIAEDGNVAPGNPKVQSEVFMPAGKTFDVAVSVPVAGGTALPIFDRELSLSGDGTERDAGMLAYIGVGGAGLPAAAAIAAASVAPDTYNVIVPCTAAPCPAVVVSDPGQGVLRKDIGVYGVHLVTPTLGGALTLNVNGTFTYLPNSGTTSDSFQYCGNASTPVTPSTTPPTVACTNGALVATVTLGPAAVEAQSGIAMNGSTFKSTVSSSISIKAPGVLAVDKDGAGYPLNVLQSSVASSGFTSLSVDPSGGFNATVPACTAATAATSGANAGYCAYAFTYSAQNSQGTVSSGSATVNVLFPPASGLTVSVKDGKTGTPITDYRWIIEEDRTFYVDPNNTTNTCAQGAVCPVVPTYGTNFHTSYMPLVAAGCTATLPTDQSCEEGQTIVDGGGVHQPAVCDIGNGVCRIVTSGTAQQTPLSPGDVNLDPTKRYYISVLPGDAGNPFGAGNVSACPPTTDPLYNTDPALGGFAGTCGHGLGGAPIPASVSCAASVGAAGFTCTSVANPLLMCSTNSLATPCTPAGIPAPSVTVLNEPTPFPTAKLTVFVFEDDFPLNGEHDSLGGIGVLSPKEPGLGGFNIKLFDDAGGSGDATGQVTYDMFNQPLHNALAGTIDPTTGLDACPISAISRIGAADPTKPFDPVTNNDITQTGITGEIVTCPKYEADNTTLSPLAGQAVVANLFQGRYGIVATPAADRIARGEEWLQTNTLDGQKAHDSFLRIGEPSFFQEYGPAGYHVSIGFANPGIINARKSFVCNNTDPTLPGITACNNSITGTVTTLRMSRTPDQRLYSSGDNSSFAFTQCYVSFGDPDGEDFAFTKCDANGQFTLSGLPPGDWRVTVFDQWNDMLVDGLSTPVILGGGATLNMGNIATNQWQANIYTTSFIDSNRNGVPDAGEPGLTLVATNIRFRDGSYSNFNNTDLAGNAGFNEIFPLFNWYVIESDTTRFKNTGTHVAYDAGGPADGTCNSSTAPCGTVMGNMANTAEAVPVPSNLRVPGAVYCTAGDCSGGESVATGPVVGGSSGPSGSTGRSTGRIDPPWVLAEGWQGFSGQNSFLDFGKIPYAEATATTPAETGGIHGEVIYASTRPFDDPTLLIHTSWTPDVPGVTINLYQEGTGADGRQTLTLIDTTQTSSWDAWAQGFRSDLVPNMNCPGQGRDTGTNADLFFFTLYNQPMWLDAYNVQHGGAAATTALPNNSQFKCFDGMHNWNQLQPAPYDGMYQFPSLKAINPTTGKWTSNCTPAVKDATTGVYGPGCIPNPDALDPFRAGTMMLPHGKYVVEMVVPPGYELVKEEDKNILIGDQYIAPVTQEFPGLGGSIYILPDQAEVSAYYNANNAQNSTNTLGRFSLPSHEGDTGSVESFWPCVGATRVVPDWLSLFPNVQEVSPFAGATRNLCDRKEVTVDDGASSLAKFWIFTSTHVAAHFTGVITDDFTSEFDPFSPQFGEKFSPPNLPVSIKDWTGAEVSRTYADQWGTYNGLVYSSWEVDPPNPTGYGPNMMVTCMNDPGTGVVPDKLYQPAYSNFCYEIPFMPGQTQYMDTPVVPTSAFAGAGYNNPDCAYPDLTPAVSEVDGDGIGPWVAASGSSIRIYALGDAPVNNYGYSGPAATRAPFNAKTITRHYGFGSSGTGSSVALLDAQGGVHPLTGVSWSDLMITGNVPDLSGAPSTCPIQQQTQYSTVGGVTPPPAYCGQLVITTAATPNHPNGQQSIDTVTVTIGGKGPTHVLANGSVQSAIDVAAPGDLIIVDPTTQATAAAPAVAAVHHEMLLMWKPVRLQGVGGATSVINGNTHPAGVLDAWRREVVCLFGLGLNGQPPGLAVNGVTNVYDPSNTFSCPSTPDPNGTASNNANFSGTPSTLKYFSATPSNPQVDRLTLEPVVGWDATQNGDLAEMLQEPSLMGALEGAAITVLAKGLQIPDGSDPFGLGPTNAGAGAFPAGTVLLNTGGCASNSFTSNFWCNPSSIDGLGVTNSSQGGGGIFVHGWGHNLQIANNRVTNNAGTLSGGINIGQGEFPPSLLAGGGPPESPPTSCLSDVGLPVNTQLPYCFDEYVNMHHNMVSLNSSSGDELFSATPAGAGGVSICNGSDYYKFNYNWVCGNLSTGDGGGVAHIGFSYNGDIEHNQVLFNQSTNPTIPTNGGGILAMGAPDADPACGASTDVDCLQSTPVAPSDGVGPGLTINANLIMGNAAESDSGGGLRLQGINGSDVVSFPKLPLNWYQVTVTNNVIVNNVAGWDGAGVSLHDALDVNIINNTIMSNDTTASAGVLFNTLGAPLASSQGQCSVPRLADGSCPAPWVLSVPQPAGLVAIQNSAQLTAALPPLSANTGPQALRQFVTCPVGHGVNGSGNGGRNNGACRRYSVPILENNIISQNRDFHIIVGGRGPGTQNQQNLVRLAVGAGTTTANSQTATGACVTSSAYWDIGVRGDTSPGNHSGSNPGQLVPRYSVLTSLTGGYNNNGNRAGNPNVVSQYCNGSRIPPEFQSMGYQVPPGISDATVPNPVFSLTPAATVDEGNNWINIAWGPLSLTNPTALGGLAGTTYGSGPALGDYSLAASSSVINMIPCNVAVAGCEATGELVPAPAKDFFGHDRPETVGDAMIDPGAIEFGGVAIGPQRPTLTAINPSSGLRGTVVNVTITGTNLIGVTGVTVTGFPGGSVVLTGVNSTFVTARITIPGGAVFGAHTVNVNSPLGSALTGLTFTVVGPMLISISPNIGLRRTTTPLDGTANGVALVLTGDYLTGATGLTGLGGGGVSVVPGSFSVAATPTLADPNLYTVHATLTISNGAALGVRNIGVMTPAGNSGTQPFTVANLTFSTPTPAMNTGGSSTKVGTITVTTNAVVPITIAAAPSVTRTTGAGTFSVTGGTCVSGAVISAGSPCTIIVQDIPPTASPFGGTAHVTVTTSAGGVALGRQGGPDFTAN